MHIYKGGETIKAIARKVDPMVSDDAHDRYVEIKRYDGKIFHMLSGKRCIKCGVYDFRKEHEVCWKCGFSKQFVYIDKGYYFGHYLPNGASSTPLTLELLESKQNSRTAMKLAFLLIHLVNHNDLKMDYIVPVPERINSNHPIRNSLILSDILCRHMRKDVCDCLYFNAETRPMKDLKREERIENIRNKISLHSGSRICGTVGIIDDIMTEGSTITECAKVLKQNGADTVYAICVGRTAPGWERKYVK